MNLEEMVQAFSSAMFSQAPFTTVGRELDKLHRAAAASDFKTVREMIKAGVDLNRHVPGLGEPPIFGAVQSKNPKMVEELIKGGADINIKTSDQMTPLMAAVKSGKVDVAKVLLDNHADMRARIGNYNSALHIAVKGGFMDMCELLIDRGLEVDVRNGKDETPLHTAAKSGKTEMVKLLLQKGAAVNAAGCTVIKADDEEVEVGSNVTPLFLAAASRQIDIVDVLIKAGANVNAKTSGKHIPLHQAAQDGPVKIVDMLLAAGSDINVRTHLGRTPLFVAARNGRADIVAALLQVEGIDVNLAAENLDSPLSMAAANGHLEVVKLLVSKGASVNGRLIRNRTLLHVALLKKKKEVAEFLVENGADFQAEDASKTRPLHLACAGGFLNLVEMLVKKGANVDARSGDGQTPLHFAAQGDHVNIVKYLVEHDADPDTRNRENESPLYCAAKKGCAKTVGYFATDCGRKVEIDSVTKNLSTPLHIAVREGHHEVAEVLLKNGANANVLEALQETPLHIAAEEGKLKIAELLIKNKAAIDLKEKKNGCTPLFLAVKKKHEKLVTLLLDKNADANAANKLGVMPLHVAAEAGNFNMVKVLLEKGAYYDAEASSKNYSGTPLKIAQKAGHTKVIKLLELIKKLFAAVIKNDTHQVGCCIQAGQQWDVMIVHARNSTGITVLHLAAHNNGIELINTLLADGVDISHATDKGILPLHIAVANKSADIAEAFLNRAKNLSFAKYNHVVNAKTLERGLTALHVVAENSVPSIVKLLLKYGAAYNSKNNKGETPLQVATSEKVKKTLKSASRLFKAMDKEDCVEEVNKILSKDSSVVNVRDADGGCTALYWAVGKGLTDVANLLLTHGADHCLVTDEGTTVLHIAASTGNMQIMKELLMRVKNDDNDRKRDFIDALTIGETTALHVAGNISVVKCLLEAGATFNLCNGENKTALDLTRNDEVKKLLKITHQLFEDVSKGDCQVLKTLDELKADEIQAVTGAQNEQGHTLVETALANAHVKIASKILEKVNAASG